MRIDLGDLTLAEGAHLLVKRALGRLDVGGVLEISASLPDTDVELRAWARAQGHTFRTGSGHGVFTLEKGSAHAGRWRQSERAGAPDPARGDGVAERPPLRWGLAARGARVEAGMPEFDFRLSEKSQLWADDAGRLYQQAVAAQWDPGAAIDWSARFELPDEVEDAVVQVMTYLIENETAALIVPSRFVAQMHPHFREVIQLLAVQAADEARHIEVFTRRATLRRDWLGLSTVGGQASLRTLVEERDFAIASFLLSVMGEGSFLTLLRFLEHAAPDPVTRSVARLAAQDEARHVAFGVAHLRESVRRNGAMLDRLAASVRTRHDALRQTSGLNEEVFDSLVLLASGGWEPDQLREGSRKVGELVREMDAGRRAQLARIGFDDADAAALSGLHTRNFM